MTATRPTEPGVIAKPEEDTLIQEMHVVVERAAVLEVGATWSERQVVAHGDPALWEIDDNGSSARPRRRCSYGVPERSASADLSWRRLRMEPKFSSSDV